jgi:hypothetical protein
MQNIGLKDHFENIDVLEGLDFNRKVIANYLDCFAR